MTNKRQVFTAVIAAILMLSTLFAAFPMARAINAPTLSPNSGSVGTKVTVSGSGASAGGQVQVYWENLAGPVLNSTYADGSGSYSLTITIPDAVAGAHSIIVRDISTGTTAGATFTITAKITLSPIRGIPGDSVSVTGSGYAAAANITIQFYNSTYSKDVTPVPVTTSATGNFTATFVVPTVDYGSYTVSATDNATTPNTSTTSFTVGAAITLTPNNGPSGAVITINGRGFTKTAGTNITVTIGSTTVPQVAQIKTLSDGTFSGQIIIPTLSTIGPVTVSATDGTYSATTPFTVTGTTGITLNPTSGQPGWTINIVGSNFTAIANTSVTVKFGALTVATLYTGASGTFNGTFTVPSLPTASYTVTATDANGLTAQATFTIAITLITVSPSSGPTGTVVTVIGYGFTSGGTANVTLGTTRVLTNIAVNDLATTGVQFIVPTVATGTYTVTVTDNAGLTASTTFTVTKTTELILSPSSAPATYVVSLTANYFNASTSITFIIKNSTYSTALSVTPASGFTGTATNATGSYKGTFAVPSLSLGSYVINATDAQGLTAEASFSIVTPTVEIRTNQNTYIQGDTVSFYVKSSLAYASTTITVTAPNSIPYTTLNIASSQWVAYAGFMYIPQGLITFVLPNDAQTGTWTWTATFDSQKMTGNFTVQTGTTINTVSSQLTALNTTVQNLQTAVSNLQSALNNLQSTVNNLPSTVSSTVSQSISGLQSSISGLQNSLNNLQSSLNVITANVTGLQASVADASTSASAAKAAVDSLTTQVASIASTLSSVTSDIAGLKTSIANLQSSVAQIPTTQPTFDMTPVWIAVAFAIVAAIAAIAGVIQISRKIAS